MINHLNENNQIKIDIPDNLRIKIDGIIKKEHDDNIDNYLANYNLMKDQNICYNHDVCYKCFIMFGWCL